MCWSALLTLLAIPTSNTRVFTAAVVEYQPFKFDANISPKDYILKNVEQLNIEQFN